LANTSLDGSAHASIPAAPRTFAFAAKTRYYRHMATGWKEQIVSDPKVLRGKPRLKSTRIPVTLVLGYLAADKTADQIITEFPDLTREQIAACVDYGRELAEFEAVV
jgi:uncharacterized protein (DUF433 family)